MAVTECTVSFLIPKPRTYLLFAHFPKCHTLSWSSITKEHKTQLRKSRVDQSLCTVYGSAAPPSGTFLRWQNLNHSIEFVFKEDHTALYLWLMFPSINLETSKEFLSNDRTWYIQNNRTACCVFNNTKERCRGWSTYLQFLHDFIHEVTGVLLVFHGSLDHLSKHLSGQVKNQRSQHSCWATGAAWNCLHTTRFKQLDRKNAHLVYLGFFFFVCKHATKIVKQYKKRDFDSAVFFYMLRMKRGSQLIVIHSVKDGHFYILHAQPTELSVSFFWPYLIRTILILFFCCFFFYPPQYVINKVLMKHTLLCSICMTWH